VISKRELEDEVLRKMRWTDHLESFGKREAHKNAV
jgi:hypothetical protein